MAERDLRERDILVAPHEYAYVQDLTKGDIVLYVGPTKISLSNTERLVEYYNDRFVPVRNENVGVNPFVSASSAQYIILENPPKDANVKPVKGANYAIEVLTGRRVVVPGPAAFPLWPGQKAEVIDAHKLREDHYLLVRVYDSVDGDSSPIGAEKIVTGADLSFYIPKTGLEVVPDDENEYVRSAVTLLDGEYCILLAPNGKRKYFRGPAVVFPDPMEEFVHHKNGRSYPAFQLKKNMGLHVRVVKDFEAAAGDQVPPGAYLAGQELFIKEKEGFFFPTEHLEVVGEVHAIPIAEKEGIYVRDIESGRISTEVGPKNYLPDPTRIEVVERLLTRDVARLYGLGDIAPRGRAISIYIPPSSAVLVTAKDRREVVRGPTTRILDYDEDLEVLKLSTGRPKSEDNLLATCFLQTDGNKVSDIVRVKTADHVELDITVSYRVSFVEKDDGDGARTDGLKPDTASIRGDRGSESGAAGRASRNGAGGTKAEAGRNPEKWFNVNNYVGLLCDHLGSLVRAAVRATPIDVFHASSTDVIRNAILGEKKAVGKRAGRLFEENDLQVYDVEILEVKILDADVKKLLADAQRTAIVFEVGKRQEQMRLDNEKLKQAVNRQIYEAQIETLQRAVDLEEAEKHVALAKAAMAIERDQLEKVGRARNEAEALEISSAARASADARTAELELRMLEAKVEAFRAQMGALAPELVTTLKVLGDQQLAGELTRNLSPLAILGGGSVAEVAERLLKGLPLGVRLVDGALASTPALQPSLTTPERKP